MAPTEAVSLLKAGGYPAAAAGKVKKADADLDVESYADTLPRMTPELLQSICKERQMWSQPHLNTQLFLNLKGFLRIEGMEDYINVRALHLDNNNISKIEGLDRMTGLRVLQLGGNRIQEISNLESNIELRSLNLEANAISHVSGVRQLVQLETLNLSSNRFEQLEDLSDLKELPSLSNLDLSSNSIEAEVGVVEFWSEFKDMKVLRYHNNPGVRHVSHYRKLIINALPHLTYMDDRPVFPVERKACKAWGEGGLTAMHEAKKEFHRERHAQNAVDADRRELVTKRRQMAIERMDREKKERDEKEEEQRLELEKKMAEMELGASQKAIDGDESALKDYAEGWTKKVNLYGVDGLRNKVAQEMSGSRWSMDSHCRSAGQTSTPQGFDFSPPCREEAAASETQPAAAAAGRREVRPPVDVTSFRQSGSGQDTDNTDRQFSVLTENGNGGGGSAAPEAPSHSAPAPWVPGQTPQGQRSAADTSTMPLIWQQNMAANMAAEAECLDRNMEIANSSNDLTGLD